MFKRIPGTKDILPEESVRWRKIENISRNIFSLYNYKEIRSPLLEESSLFQRTLGESSEIIQKQMFLIRSKEDTYCLRPEGTASIVRSYIENNLDKTSKFIKLYYMGPMFRLERPQKGRLRQFNHIGCEAIGSQDAHLDVEIISLADNLLKALSIGGYEIKINSLGCAEDKKELAEGLRKGLKGRLSKLCVDCQRRFKTNVLRILDCKNEACRNIISELEIKEGYLCEECLAHFSKVKEGLDSLNLSYRAIHSLVRGLDYYTRTVFEITHHALGAQDAIGAGGRYDNLVEELGGPDLGAIGFALGVERILLVASRQSPVASQRLVYLITLGDEARKAGVKLLNELRKNGISCDTDYENKSLKGAMRAANDSGARFAVILGEDELKNNAVTLKDMGSGEQRQLKQEELIASLRATQKAEAASEARREAI